MQSQIYRDHRTGHLIAERGSFTSETGEALRYGPVVCERKSFHSDYGGLKAVFPIRYPRRPPRTLADIVWIFDPYTSQKYPLTSQ